MKLILFLLFLGLVACELPNVEGLNKMPETTNDMKTTTKTMSEDMKAMKQATHLLTLSSALEGMNKFENQQLISPLPTGLMAFGKVFAEEATAVELIEQTYVWLREIEEILPVEGLTQDGSATEPSPESLMPLRLKKTARLYSAMIIAGFAQDEKITEIINSDILGYSRYESTALQFLALRAFFYREIMLKTSLKVDSSSSSLLSNSGMMEKALEYLLKLDQISRLEFADRVEVHLKEKYYNLLEFEEIQNQEGRALTAAMWKTALEKALAGHSEFKKKMGPSDSRGRLENEFKAQEEVILKLRAHSDAWDQKP